MSLIFIRLLFKLKKNLGYHQKESLNYAYKAGELLIKIKKMCRREKRNIQDFLKDCDIHWSRSYCSFLIYGGCGADGRRIATS